MFEKLELEVQRVLLEAAQTNATSSVHGNHPWSNMCCQYQLSLIARKLCFELKQLINSCSFSKLKYVRKPPIKPVERLQAQPLVGQKAQQRLEQLLQLLDDDRFGKVGIWAMGGVGKTLLAKNLNNKLESFSMREPFDVVIWISATKDLNLKDVQSQVAKRVNLELDAEESIDRKANRLLGKLLLRKKLLLVFDSIWEKIDLDILGIPHGDGQNNCKILVTTRFLDVCRQMMTDIDLKVDVMEDEEAWDLFAGIAGDVVKLEDVYPLAREVARECCGLPLAIITMAKSMSKKPMVQLWRDTLRQLKRSCTQFGSIEVFDSLKLSYYSLPSKILRWCFLYCSLYPENYSIKASELVHCWIADELIVGHQTLEETFDNGIALIEHLKDSCMLEEGDDVGTVKIHGILRGFAIWISSNEPEIGFSCQCSN
ncbi:NB-ARC domain containing protein [Parasponia andersonii]|uniref:NB-ARC domain containing protein n=1 Tax=Parasponia andersonii TaxID=3476 RepID=A0A2P5CKC1_PARAD|nr:NB-ARC domain containing protein [Parasponia andersonii]